MADVVAHRGPDDEGYYLGPGVALGHRRLSIIDLSTGHQPMVSKDGRYVIVYNGEVYNFPSLRRELAGLGQRFFTRSDTEVLLAAFAHWGPACFTRFKGMFALAIWDSRERSLHLARDHMGIKPLYFTQMGPDLIFASEIKALLCHPQMDRRMDPEVLACFLAFNNSFGPRSFWQGVRRLQPGEQLKWRQGRIQRNLFFDIGSLQTEPFAGDFDQACSAYRQALQESVEDHLISDVPLGSNLSGGIDSPSVATLAARSLKKSLPVFTGYFVGHEGGWFDERPGAEAVAKTEDMNLFPCPISSQDFQDSLEEAAYHLDEPTLGSGAVPQYVVARRAAQEVKVVLTGHAGDELFAGYPAFKAALLQEGFSWERLRFKGLDELARMAYFLVGGFKDPLRARGQFRMFSDHALAKVAAPGVMEAIDNRGGTRALLEAHQPFPSAPTLDGMTRWYIATYLPTLLMQEDKIAMAHGLEGRVPICYEPLVRFALSLPGSLKMHSGVLKAVPREGMRQILPPLIYSLPKRGFPTPVVSWLSGELGRQWKAEWRRPLPGALEGLLVPQGIMREFDRFCRWGKRLPNAYPLAHRLISLQTLLACARTLEKVEAAKEPEGSVGADLPGSLYLGEENRRGKASSS
jgi:asparagine synthase (glutamine-hydrolysing)